MNPLLSNIYGTCGGPDLEKAASEGFTLPANLSELADAITIEISPKGEIIEKVASTQTAILDDLVQVDMAGRMMAQAEFSEMEKQAAEGDPSALEAFFADVEENPDDERRKQLRHAVGAEMQRRGLR
jgi:hypothetical protein